MVPEFLRVIQEWRMEVFGALLIIMMIIRPQGVIGLDTVQGIKKILGMSGGKDVA
jgi:branched-chain amino acid transport system permease protein